MNLQNKNKKNSYVDIVKPIPKINPTIDILSLNN